MKMLAQCSVAGLLAMLIAFPSVVAAAPTDPDLSFNFLLGYVDLGVDNLDEWPTDVVTAADGSTYVAGITETAAGTTGRRPAVWRIKPNGDPDHFFGNASKYEIPFDLPGNQVGSFVDVGLTSDGGIVVSFPGDGGSPVNKNFFVVKIKPDGTGLDLSFGLLGVTGVAFDYITGGNDWPYDLAVQPDDKIVVVGYGEATSVASNDEDFAVARFTASGGVDSSFAGDGTVRAYWDSGNYDRDDAYGVTLTSTGEIIVVGVAETSVGWDMAVLALDSFGNTVSSFDGDGRATYQFYPFGGPAAGDTRAFAVTTTPLSIPKGDAPTRTIYDTIYIAGMTVDPTVLDATQDLAVLCIGGSGGLCGGFGVQGWTTVDFSDPGLFGIGDTDDWGVQIVADSTDDTLTVFTRVGQVGSPQHQYAGLARILTANGAYDTSFGNNGKKYFTANHEYGMQVAGTMDQLDRILLATDGYDGVDEDIRLDRLVGSIYIFEDGFELGNTSMWSDDAP